MMARIDLMTFLSLEAKELYPVITIISTPMSVAQMITNCPKRGSFGFRNCGINATKKTVALMFVRLISVA